MCPLVSGTRELGPAANLLPAYGNRQRVLCTVLASSAYGENGSRSPGFPKIKGKGGTLLCHASRVEVSLTRIAARGHSSLSLRR